MHYRMISSDFLQRPTELQLLGKRYTREGILYRDRHAWNITVYSISERKIHTLELLYSEYILYSIVIEDAVLERIIGW